MLSTFSTSQSYLFKYTKPSLLFCQSNPMDTTQAYGDEDGNGDDSCVDEDDLISPQASSNHQKQISSSPVDKEKQISVDPMSLKQSTAAVPMLQPPLLKPKFISASLPCSTASSPQWGSALPTSFQGWRAHDQRSQRQAMHLRRSKSCGEGRACPPSDEFDVLSRKVASYPPPPANESVHVMYECSDDMISNTSEPEERDPNSGEGFKCGALCLFLPGLSKKKHAQPNHSDELEYKGAGYVSQVISLDKLSRMASLEKFECGSWSESAILDGDEDEGGIHSYFDLPLELIRIGANDADSPVKTAFVFERDRKGVLKKNTSRLAPRKSHESSNRHVRFSTSAPTSYPQSPSSACITPRLLKAREEFNALLEAQGA